MILLIVLFLLLHVIVVHLRLDQLFRLGRKALGNLLEGVVKAHLSLFMHRLTVTIQVVGLERRLLDDVNVRGTTEIRVERKLVLVRNDQIQVVLIWARSFLFGFNYSLYLLHGHHVFLALFLDSFVFLRILRLSRFSFPLPIGRVMFASCFNRAFMFLLSAQLMRSNDFLVFVRLLDNSSGTLLVVFEFLKAI